MKELSFKLSEPIQVSKDGGFEEIYELVFTAPSMKDRKQVAKVMQFIARAKDKQQSKFISIIGIDALKEMADSAKASGSDVVDTGEDDAGEKGLRDILASSDEDLETFYEAFQTLMLRVCTIDEGVLIKQVNIDIMQLGDFENACFEYCENFIK